jgi:hypothetical protein
MRCQLPSGMSVLWFSPGGNASSSQATSMRSLKRSPSSHQSQLRHAANAAAFEAFGCC